MNLYILPIYTHTHKFLEHLPIPVKNKRIYLVSKKEYKNVRQLKLILTLAFFHHHLIVFAYLAILSSGTFYLCLQQTAIGIAIFHGNDFFFFKDWNKCSSNAYSSNGKCSERVETFSLIEYYAFPPIAVFTSSNSEQY